MNREFNTTFIPKKSVAPVKPKAKKSKKPMGVVTLLSILAFVITIVLFLGVVIREKTLLGKIEEQNRVIASAQSELDEEFLGIMSDLDKRIRISTELLDNHIAISPFLRVLASDTLPAMQYDEFQFSFDEETDLPVVEMNGQSIGYMTIAQQSRLFKDQDFVAEHFFSGFSLNDEEKIEFEIEADVDADLIKFKESLLRVGQN